MDKYLLDILSEYGINSEEIKYIKPFGNGHINSTYKIRTFNDVFILQKINHNVFKNPCKLMENIVAVTSFIKEKEAKFDTENADKTLTVIKTLSGNNLVHTENGEYYRLQKCIDAITVDSGDLDILLTVGETFGKFQNQLAEFPANTLYEVIPNFHNTAKRYLDLEESINNNLKDRVASVENEIEYARSFKDQTAVIVDGLNSGEIPLRVTHNDTKLNNVLLDKDTFKGICVIDLDTIMPGSYLYDYGDALRFAASSAAEDENDLSKIFFDMDKFEAFTNGYVSQLKNKLTESEIELMPFSVELMTYECGIRFLTDYLNGDTYFKIHYPEQNLRRAKAQFALAKDIHNKIPQMKKIINKYLKSADF